MTSPVIAVAVLFPRLMDLHGDSANARVLKARAGWEGIDVQVLERSDSADFRASAPDIAIVGSTSEGDLTDAAELLRFHGSRIRDWHESGCQILAIGTGLDLLSASVELAPGRAEAGIGIFSGSATLLSRWASGALSVRMAGSRTRTLGGFENHARGYVLGPGEEHVGRVARGIGNGDRREGVERAGAVGTHLHGPVLSNNPAVADGLLTRALRRRHGEDFTPRSAATQSADALAMHIRDTHF